MAGRRSRCHGGMLPQSMNSLACPSQGEADELRRIELGDRPSSSNAVRSSSRRRDHRQPPAEVQEEMRIFLERAERRYGPMMAPVDGDPQESPACRR